MTTEADEPGTQEVSVTPPPEKPTPFQRVMDKFQAELGRLSGQLLVERAEREMERESLMETIVDLQQQLGGDATKSDDEQAATEGAGTPVTPIHKPTAAKRSGGKNRR